jgi:hypothetical protein
MGAGNASTKGKNVYKNQNNENIDDGFNQWPTTLLLIQAKKIKPKDKIIEANLIKTNSVILTHDQYAYT